MINSERAFYIALILVVFFFGCVAVEYATWVWEDYYVEVR